VIFFEVLLAWMKEVWLTKGSHLMNLSGTSCPIHCIQNYFADTTMCVCVFVSDSTTLVAILSHALFILYNDEANFLLRD
jgi:hypothetical protein